VAHRLGAEVKASIHLDVPNDELVRRLLARSRGSEDSQAVIARRIEVYQQKTVPLLEYYAQREWLLTVDGSQSEDDVHEAIAEKVASMAPPASTD
jgi:adenylate kinase